MVDSAEAVAKKVSQIARNEGEGNLRLFFTDNSPNLRAMIRLILGQDLKFEIVPVLCRL